MSETRSATETVRYRERLRVPWWWWLPGLGVAAIIAFEVTLGVSAIPAWIPYVVLGLVTAAAITWLGRVDVRVVTDATGETEFWAGAAHLPVGVIARSAEVPRTAKSAALGRQLDPAAFVVHRAWVGPMILVVLDDPDDPTPYWLVSTRHPDRLLAALRGES